jgi:uncharacterized protein (DUF2141 family)
MRIIFSILALVLMFAPGVVHAQLATVTIRLHSLEPTTGSVEVSLFNSEDTFMNKPMVQQSREVGGKSELVFEFAGVLEGRYAAVAVHDENGNGVLDNGFLGFGGESYGFSNDSGPWVGYPSFEAASFEVGKENLEITFRVD